MHTRLPVHTAITTTTINYHYCYNILAHRHTADPNMLLILLLLLLKIIIIILLLLILLLVLFALHDPNVFSKRHLPPHARVAVRVGVSLSMRVDKVCQCSSTCVSACREEVSKFVGVFRGGAWATAQSSHTN